MPKLYPSSKLGIPALQCLDYRTRMNGWNESVSSGAQMVIKTKKSIKCDLETPCPCGSMCQIHTCKPLSCVTLEKVAPTLCGDCAAREDPSFLGAAKPSGFW